MRNPITSDIRRQVGVDELRRLAQKIVAGLTADPDYREDLIQCGLLKALRSQQSDPLLPTRILCKSLLWGMLHQMRNDRMNKKLPNYTGRPALVADLLPAGCDLPSRAPGFGRLDSALVAESQLADAMAAMTTKQADLYRVMLTLDCMPTEAGRILGISETNAHRLFSDGARRARRAVAA